MAVAIVGWLLYLLAFYLGAIPYQEVCDKGYYDGAKHCTSYDSLSALLLNIALFFEQHNAIVGAAATVFIATFTIILAGVGRDQHKAAMGALKVASDEFIANHRPWIPDEVRIASGITFDEQGIHLTLRFFLQNIGNSPAYRVFPNASFVPSTHVWENHEKLMADNSLNPINIGFTLFPKNDPIAVDVTINMSNEELKTAIVGGDDSTILSILIVGSIKYRGLTDAGHQTGFIYDINKNTVAMPEFKFSLNMADDVPIERVILSNSLMFQPKAT